MNQKFYISFFLPLILSSLLSIFFIPFFYSYSTNSQDFSTNILPSDNNIFLNFNTSFFNTSIKSTATFLWPTPGYSTITSNFGYRKSPTTGASSYHGGIDIGAPENSSIVAVQEGIVSFVGWNGANGYTIKIKHSNGYESTYGHVSPFFLVSTGQTISKGSLIAKVGPKYISKKDYTTYKDATGKYTNGATTGPHLHFAVSKDNKKINPMDIFD